MALPFLAWGTVALALDGPERVAAGAYALGSLALLVLVRPRGRAWLACGGLFGLVLGWWLTIEPRNDRDWLPDVALLTSPTSHTRPAWPRTSRPASARTCRRAHQVHELPSAPPEAFTGTLSPSSKPRGPRRSASLALALLGLAACKAPPSREKSDTVRLVNGDRITGEVKKLEQGKLRLKTSALDTVYVQWDEISELTSGYDFEFEDTSGVRLFGRIVGQDADTITIETDDGRRIALPLAQVVEITPIDESLWSRIDGGVSVGFDYNRATDVANLTTSFDLQHRTRKTRSELDFSSTITSETEGERTSRSSLSLGSNRYRQRWFVWGTAALETNDALGLDLRSTLSAGGGRSLISTSQSLLDIGVGLAISEEDSAGQSASASVLEGVARATYSIFRFTEREVDSDFELLVFPGITESGRVRGELDANVRREIAKNLYIELTGYFSYDNEPPGGSEKSDYGVYMSLGWSF